MRKKYVISGTLKRIALWSIAFIVPVHAATASPSWPRMNANIEFDPVLGLPIPPIEVPYNAVGTKWVIIGLLILGMVGVILGIRDLIKRKSWLPLMLAASGVAIAIPEVFVDIVGAVWYPTSPNDIAFTIFGRQMGWFILSGWFGFGSVFCYLCFRLFDSGKATKWIWGTFLAACVGEVIIEEIIQAVGGIYIYYGNQPLVLLWKLPWWWIPCNSGGVFLAAAVAVHYKKSLQGWKSLLMFITTPLSMTACYGAIALPSWIAVNGAYSYWVTQALGLVTIVLGVAFVGLIINVFLKRNPFDLKGTGDSA